MPSSGMTSAGHRTIRCGVGGNAILGGTIHESCQNSSRRAARAEAVVSLLFEPVGQQRQAGADVAYHLGMREVDLLDVGGRVADVDHQRPKLGPSGTAPSIVS